MPINAKPQIISDPAALAQHLAELRSVGWFGFDTEFVGEDVYKPEVCLIQTATRDAQSLIDPLSGLDTRSFWELVADSSVRKIVHAGSEDLAQCVHQIGLPAANVIDLQIAAGMVGMGYPTSLARLVHAAVGAKLHKSQTLTDWRLRPLTQEQVDYAVQDVEYLPHITEYLQEKLDNAGRTDWLRQECDVLCRSAADQTQNPVQLRRLRGAASLGAKEQTIAEALLEERNRLAQELDRPPRTILRDHLLVELARRGWTDPKRIGSLRGLSLPAWAVRRLATAVEQAKRRPPVERVLATDDGDSNEEETLIALLTAVLRDFCNGNSIAYPLLANKEDLRRVVRRRTRKESPSKTIALQEGWRGQVVGGLVEDVLFGRAGVRVIGESGDFRLKIED